MPRCPGGPTAANYAADLPCGGGRGEHRDVNAAVIPVTFATAVSTAYPTAAAAVAAAAAANSTAEARGRLWCVLLVNTTTIITVATATTVVTNIYTVVIANAIAIAIGIDIANTAPPLPEDAVALEGRWEEKVARRWLVNNTTIATIATTAAAAATSTINTLSTTFAVDNRRLNVVEWRSWSPMEAGAF